ncbi:hypothetical protein DPEC_G00339470 [Dallia pectoralis]|uniref:Uncharacterized protein n=1 Tax=Dallia pectoralis TaxID=75939 RepID=A0ACC2F4X4_DALPE|nr:hypothetical protein DPEC_G00339470 [Dallia pectoralis]
MVTLFEMAFRRRSPFIFPLRCRRRRYDDEGIELRPTLSLSNDPADDIVSVGSALMIANCGYRVVIVISVTRDDMLLSCELPGNGTALASMDTRFGIAKRALEQGDRRRVQ